jgi:hypothetical protein
MSGEAPASARSQSASSSLSEPLPPTTMIGPVCFICARASRIAPTYSACTIVAIGSAFDRMYAISAGLSR